MRVLDKELIKLNIELGNSEDVIKELGKLMEKGGYVKETYVNAVLEREKIYPTGLPTDGICVAIPHTDSSHVNSSAVSIGILKREVEFGMMGDIDTKFNVGIVMLLAIDNPEAQVKLLQKLMTMVRDKELLIKLKNAASKEEVVRYLSFLNDEENVLIS